MPDGNEEERNLLVRELGIHWIISSILTGRHILTPDEARKYLYPSLHDLHNPFLMKDMLPGVDRMISAVYRKEKVVVYGDYDADGITSVAVLVKFLREIQADAGYYIPDRIEEGYGLNRKAIDRIKDGGASLIVTVDCGISDRDEVLYAASLGLDTIILDHHEVSGPLPNAVASINPKRPDDTFPLKHLAAVGIVFNFLIALRGSLRKNGFWHDKPYPNLKEYLDLVALGTIGDICPMVDENRIFSRVGLELLTEGKRTGIRALKEISGIDDSTVDSEKASFCLIPRINAAGRVGLPGEAVELLLSDSVTEARELALKLESYNRKRRALEKVILDEIVEHIDSTIDSSNRTSFVMASDKWHPGVIGIVASKIADRYDRPAILISLRDGVGKGSGRSIANFNIFQGLKECEDYLISYGGHRYAAGISILEEDIAQFSDLLDEIVRENVQKSDFVSATFIDAQCHLNDITHELLSQMELLAPFGSRNPEPVLCVRNVNALSPAIVGKNHLRMRVSQSGVSRNSIWFSQGHFIRDLHDSFFDIAFTPQINYWNGSSDIQLKMKDIKVREN
ncbi:MAG: Single-stranded-DNA-specific exonuclease RecJ [Syntrophus sp. PtaU1.Bin005]|jgi:single-stranded-DNA-specific exonuclease|uniref:single-stranded-DNA-specific exonuclease RecJ n=1 Tax=Syntrophus sp. (in: bacteria) TaxID=48412 RepID=UPI0009D5EB67|nr:MAG: Single-stranded-DNA-specific exonuclease RecJ [Syntrophus sp. PtaB.Bin138]OPY81815.1 MAG: Single-stranded-DNA-specific exonuclease RecJ [Syntrophus sp. PtaU1.Bin005]